MTSEISGINYPLFARLLGRIAGPPARVVIIGPEGELLWKDQGLEAGDEERLLAAGRRRIKPSPRQNWWRDKFDGRHDLVGILLGKGPELPRGWLLVLLKSADSFLHGDHSPEQALIDIAALLGEALESRFAQSEMAAKLLSHNNELNFIYGTDSYLDGPSSIAESMHNIVTECCHHMDMDAAAILAPSQNIWTSHQEDSGEPKDRQDRLREFSEQVLRQVISTGQTKQLKQLLPAGEAMAGQVSVIVSPIKSRQGNPVGLFALFRRAEKKKFSLSEEKVGEVLATRIGKYMLMGLDPLTGILDRIGFEEQVATILARPAEGRGLCTLAKIDIDGFALVNDTYSVSGGDQVLKQLARLIKDYIWVDDVVARTGGDEFCIILHGAGLGQGSVIIERLRRKIAKAFFAYDNRLISISASIGLFAVHDCGGNLTEIDSALDVACQNAKENGGNRVQVYSGNNLELRRRRSEISFAAMIDDAIEEERFELYCQPLVPLWGANFHYEILLRLNNENGDIIPPDDFMGAAERYNRLPGIDRWVVAKAFKMLGEAAKKLEGLELCWGINLTGQSLAEESFRHFVEEQIRAIEFPAKWVYFEITESVAIRNIEQVTDFVSRIKGLGCDFALDDFGTGYSSYGYLKNLPVKCLKIDGSFIRNLNNDPFNQLAVQSINQLAHYLGLQTVAEYVETEEVAQLLRKIGIDYAQGYSYGKPQPLRQVLAAL